MARLVIGTVFGVIVGATAATACQSHADQDIPQEVVDAAHDAQVDPTDLMGAVNTTSLSPREYLYAVGELARPYTPPPAASNGWPIGGALGQRIYCVENLESSHGRRMWNPIPVGREHAQGFLGWLPSTARGVGVVIGNRGSEWAGAARMLAAGRGREFFGIQAHLC